MATDSSPASTSAATLAASAAPSGPTPATTTTAVTVETDHRDPHHEPDRHVFHHDAERASLVPEHQRRVIMIAVDASDNSINAFNWALKNFLRQETDVVVLVNVRLPSSVPGPYGAAYIDFSDVLSRMEEHSRKVSHALLQKYGEILKSRSFDCKAVAIRGDPRYDVVRKATDLKVEALIMGSRGMGAIKRTLLGSVSDYCVHHVPMPVIIVKMQEKVTALPDH